MNIKAVQYDCLKRTVIFSYPPKRIVSLCPSITETLFSVGAGGLLAGRTDYCIHPAEGVNAITAVGGTKNFRIDEILAMKPDLVIAEKEENPKNKILKLAESVPVFVFDVQTFDDALAMTAKLGVLTGNDDRAFMVTNKIRHAFEEVSVGSRRRAAYLIWEKPLMAAGGNTFINAMMDKAGFENIFADREERYPKISVEELQKKKPEVLILSTEPCEYTEKDVQRYRRLLPETEVMLIEGDLFSWYGARMLKAAEFIRGKIQRGEKR